MPEDTADITRRRLLRAAGVAAASATGLTAPAAAAPGDPEYPSEAWFAREQANWARTREAPLRQANDPAFQKRLYEQSLVNFAETQQRRVEESGWRWGWNLCQRYAMQCAGDPYLYPAVETPVAPSDVEPERLESSGNIAEELGASVDVERVLEHLEIDVDGDEAAAALFGSALGGGRPETNVSPEAALEGGTEAPPTASLESPAAVLDAPTAGDVSWSGHSFYDDVGGFERVAFYDSGLDQDEGGARLSGRVWAPQESGPGDALPGVVITNGSIQAPEPIYWWFAHTLVEAGYVVMTYDPRGQGRSDNQTPDGTQGGNADPSVFVTNQVDAIDFFRSTPEDTYQHNTDDVARGDHDAAPVVDHNPFWDRLDRDRLGIVGHSLGATGVSVVQGMEWPEAAKGERNPVDVAVAWDNLSAAGSELAGREVTPRVPAMGQGADYFAGVPKTAPPEADARLSGFESWRDAGVPTYQLNIRGGTHFEWALIPTFPTTDWDGWGNELAEHFSLAWLDFWLKTDEERNAGGRGGGPGPAGGETAERRLLEAEPWRDRLSFYYDSARYLPPAGRRDSWPASGENPEGWYVCENLREGC